MKHKIFKILPLLMAIIMLLSACTPGIAVTKPPTFDEEMHASFHQTLLQPEEVTLTVNPASFDFDAIPAFDNYTPYVILNGNVPDFTDKDLTERSYEYYSRLDSLGRCGECIASIGKDLMPTQKRGAIGQVKPTGWDTKKYNNVDGNYLYNRCHLIGYQLTAENANEQNLITGTRYLNVDGMLPFEDEVASYVKRTGNHVLYRVTPLFKGKELVARGVLMEGFSVEDLGEGICFNVYCYNNQPGIEIDYATGKSKAKKESYKFNDGSDIGKFTVNITSKKFHKPTCSGAKKMSKKNKREYIGSRQNLIKNGYDPCPYCKP